MSFDYSPRVQDLRRQLIAFMDEHVYPNELLYYDQVKEGDRWKPVAIVEELKQQTKAAGLWNFFLELTNLEYAPLCEIMGRSLMAPEVFNCSAPDTGNMEVIARYGTADHQAQGLPPPLAGEIRSAFAMPEPDVASADATNVACRIDRDGDTYRINGRKW